ncbi:hypothetical protein I4U23_026620 [Adineta vaga]|nr:hypothetical protein I4U23_026620 [Adineta vaga]
MLTKRHRYLYCFHRHLSSNSTRKYDDYNYFKRSLLLTDHFQHSLPRLPIPQLDKTCERYLTALKPILNNDENAYKETQKILADFRTGDGKRLDAQLRLKNASNRNTSYISKPWFEMYLKSRLPLILNSNFFLVFTDDQQKLKPAARLTNYIISSIRFMNTLRANWLDPEVYHLNPKKTNTDRFRKNLRLIPKSLAFYGAFVQKAFPLDMSQYNRLFKSTRVPKSDCDVLETSNENIRHIIVIKRGHYYKVNVLDENGDLFPAETIASMIKYLAEDLNDVDNEYPLGYFTADKRDRWAMVRTQMETISEHNKQMFKEIDNSIMVICLDEDDPDKLNKSLNKQQQLAEYVSGKYLCYNASNRWYDKSFNMIMLLDGTLGLHCEHSWGDGVALLRFCNDIDKDANGNNKINSTNYQLIKSSTNDSIEKLEFHFDDQIKNEFNISKQNYKEFISKFNVNIFQEPILGKNLLKKSALSPDAIMQLGIQMAYYKLHHRFVSTYESCSTAVYKHGRTETIRPVTNETKNFIEALTKSNDDKFKKDLLKKSSEKHQLLIKQAATGQGFDRHLFALKYLQEIENKEELHRIYKDKSYQLMNYNILSTSTVASKHIVAGGFGPVVNDGYGIGYLIDDEQCGLLVTSYLHKELPSFMQAADESFRELATIIKS